MENQDVIEYQNKVDARKIALNVAQHLVPVNVQNTAINSGISVKPTCEQVLKDADKIYAWLIDIK